MTEDEMVGWHHRLDGHGFGWTPRVGDGQGGLVCYSSWSHKEVDTTERLNLTELKFITCKEKRKWSPTCIQFIHFQEVLSSFAFINPALIISP